MHQQIKGDGFTTQVDSKEIVSKINLKRSIVNSSSLNKVELVEKENAWMKVNEFGIQKQPAHKFLNKLKQEKWQSKHKVQVNLSAREAHKKQIQLAKDVFLLWDADGQGSLTPDELISAFVRIGLSSDHHFAKQIMYALKPPSSGQKVDTNFEISLHEFLSVFKNDFVSD